MKCEEQKGHPLGKRPFNQDPGEKEEPGMFMPREKHSRHRDQREQRFGAGENLVCLSGRKEEAGGRKFGIHEGDEDRRARSEGFAKEPRFLFLAGPLSKQELNSLTRVRNGSSCSGSMES